VDKFRAQASGLDHLLAHHREHSAIAHVMCFTNMDVFVPSKNREEELPFGIARQVKNLQHLPRKSGAEDLLDEMSHIFCVLPVNNRTNSIHFVCGTIVSALKSITELLKSQIK
jgi:hypothetical protein